MKSNSIERPICLFLPNLAGGGAERVFVTLANSIAAKDIPVDLVIANHRDAAYAEEIDSKVNVIYLNVNRTLMSLPKLTKYLNAAKPQSIMTSMAHANLIGKFALTLSGSKTTRHIVRQAIAPGIMPVKNRVLTKLLKPFIFFVYKKAYRVVSVSSEMTQMLKDAYQIEHNLATIYNPVDSDHIENASLLNPDPNLNCNWNNNNISRIIAVGRLNEQKDFKTLINAFAIAAKQKKLTLLILGEGEEPLTRQIADLGLSDLVHMPGFTPNPFPYMKKADVFVLSSRYEGLPNALIQALMLRTRCVSTKCPTGPAEILENGELGELVEVGDTQSLANAILSSIQLPKLPEKTAQSIKTKYSATRITDQYLCLLRSHSTSDST
jgi:glycosyltransferase involved in cell wall biosynthesis